MAVVLMAIAGPGLGAAHEVRPAFLELREDRAGEFSVRWKTPMVGEARLALAPAFSGASTSASPVITERRPGAAIQTWRLRAPALPGQTLRVDGLEGTMTVTERAYTLPIWYTPKR
jgi:hypothetical protein